MTNQQNLEFLLYVTHVEAEDIFLKIWGQTDKNSAICIENLIKQHYPNFAHGLGHPDGHTDFVPNTLCCARFQDGYYRARICNLRPDGMVFLQFIDYGNYEVVQQHEVHVLHKIPGTESLQTYPALATDYYLANVLPVKNMWDKETIESIRKLLCYNELRVLSLSVIDNRRFTHIFYSSEDFGGFLVRKGIAISVTLQEMLRPKYLRQPYGRPQQQPIINKIPTSSYMQSPIMNNKVQTNPYMQSSLTHNNISNESLGQTPILSDTAANSSFVQSNVTNNPYVPPQVAQPTLTNNPLYVQSPIVQSNVPNMSRFINNPQNNWQNQMTNQKSQYQASQNQYSQNVQPPAQEALVFKSRVLEIDSKHNVIVSFMEEGPVKFSVQIDSLAPVLKRLMLEIQSHPTEPLREPPLPGSVCLGRYTKDQILCRAVIMAVMDMKCKVYYVDFGHTEILAYTDIYQLPSQFINPKVLSIRFTLSGIRDIRITDEMKEYFKKIVANKTLILHVRPPEGPPLIQYGDLFDNGVNIRDLLKKEFPAPPVVMYTQPMQLTKGTREIVYVSYVESCKVFYVQIDNKAKFLEALMNSLVEYAPTAPLLHQIQVTKQTPCTAMYEDGWYRAEVLSTFNDKAKIFYVDYGNEESVSISTLRTIRNDLVTNLDAQAIKCFWNGYEPMFNDPEATKEFNTLILEARFIMQVVDVVKGVLLVNLYDLNTNEDIKTKFTSKISSKTISQKISNDNTFQAKKQYSPRNVQSEETNWRKSSSPTKNDSFDSNKSKQWKDGTNERRVNLNSKFDRCSNDFQDKLRFNSDNMKDRNESIETNGTFSKGSRPTKKYERSNENNSRLSRSNDSDKSVSDMEVATKNNKSQGRKIPLNRDNRMKRDTPTKNHTEKCANNFHDGYKMKDDSNKSDNIIADSRNSNQFSKTGNAESQILSPSISIGSVKLCEIVYGQTPTDFFVQFSSDYEDLCQMMIEITTIYEDGGKILDSSKLKPGVFCVAEYQEDLKWYRGLIQSIKDNTACVMFVDYGNVEYVNLDKIKVLEPKFSKLPMQAIHCKLHGVDKNKWNDDEIILFHDCTDGKSLELEIVSKERDMYVVKLREVVNSIPLTNFINEKFCDKYPDVNHETGKKAVNAELTEIECVPPNARWQVTAFELNSKAEVVITWFTNPKNFYCQVTNGESKFREMMTELQKVYSNKNSITTLLEVGSPVIALFDEDQAFYRAEILELNKGNGHVVRYIDFGNCALVEKNKLFPVDKKFVDLPKQAIHSCLKDVMPYSSRGWPKPSTREFDPYFNAEKYECVFYGVKDDKYEITLSSNGKDVTQLLIDNHLVTCPNLNPVVLQKEKSMKTTPQQDIQKLNLKNLENQILNVVVESVRSLEDFSVCILPSVQEFINESIYCSCYECSSSNGNKLKSYEGKQIIVSVEEAKNDRLRVRLFDNFGKDLFAESNSDISPICPMPILDSTYKVLVSYADHAGSMWLQKCKDYETETSLAAAIGNYYSNSSTIISPTAGLLCAAKSSDGNWYRGKIISSNETNAYVHFIDYGNTEEVQFEYIKELSSEFYLPHQLSIQVSLNVTISGTELEQADVLQNHLGNKELTATFYKVNNNWVVEIFDEDGKFSDKLQSLDLVTVSAPPCATSAKSTIPSKEDKFDVVVSHVDSPSQFWLQRVDEIDQLNIAQKELQEKVLNYPVVNDVMEVNTICCVNYSLDNSWYRAQVLDADEEVTTVCYIDTGKTDVVDNKKDNIRELPDDVKNSKRFATKCRLNVIPIKSEDWDEIACTSFKCILSSANSLQASVILNVSPMRVELFANEKKISEDLIAKGMAGILSTDEELVDETIDVELDPRSAFVSHFNSLDEFWVQEEKSISDLEVMTDRLLIANMLPTLINAEIETLCVALYPIDGLWYRARITSILPNGYNVIYIDYGNSAETNEIRVIPDDIANIPPLSRKCQLAKPMGVKEWTTKACDEFTNVAQEGATIFLLEVLKEGEVSLVKLMLQGKNITDHLAAFCEQEVIITQERPPPIGEETSLNNIFPSKTETLSEKGNVKEIEKRVESMSVSSHSGTKIVISSIKDNIGAKIDSLLDSITNTENYQEKLNDDIIIVDSSMGSFEKHPLNSGLMDELTVDQIVENMVKSTIDEYKKQCFSKNMGVDDVDVRDTDIQKNICDSQNLFDEMNQNENLKEDSGVESIPNEPTLASSVKSNVQPHNNDTKMNNVIHDNESAFSAGV